MRALVPLATGYAGVLLLVAAGLEWLSRHTAARSHRYRTAGFTYHPDHDLWMCPRDEPLWPYEVDRRHRLVRYRARPTVCNACPVKDDCTSSPDGREIVRPVDPWPHSEAGRFHRGVSVTLTFLAATILTAVAAGYHRPPELALLLPAGALTGWLLWHWSRDFLRTPSGFPEIDPVRHPGRGERSVRAPGSARTPGSDRAPGADPAPGTDRAPGADRAPDRDGRGQALADLIPPSRRNAGSTWGFGWRPGRDRYRSARRAEPPPTGTRYARSARKEDQP